MPIKFACPSCKNVLSVPSNLAGKSGKCKCGAQIKIPVPKAQAAAVSSTAGQAPAAQQAAAAPPSSNMFDELTQGDYGRQDPYMDLYHGKKTNNDASTLSRFTDEIKAEKEKEVGQAKGLMIFAAILNFISALGFGGLGVALAVVSTLLNSEGLVDALPILNMGMALAMVFCFTFSALLIASGVGGIMRTSWGWFLMAMLYSFFVVDRLVGLGMMFTEEFNQARFFGGLIGCLAVFSLTMFIFKDTTREMCHIKSKVPVIVSLVLGVLLAGGQWGALFAIGSAAENEIEQMEQDAGAEP